MSTILGGGSNILSAANSLLDNGRAIFARNGGTGMSGRSRQLLEGFYNNGTALFNQLYARTESKELSNQIDILALRAKNKSLVASGVFEDPTAVAPSTTTGTNVDTQA